MSSSFILQGVLPLVIFVIVDLFAGPKIGILCAVAFACLELGFDYFNFGGVEESTWISVGLVVILGGLSIKTNNMRLFKFQPAILGVSLAAILAYYQWFDQPLLIKILPKMKHLMAPEQQAVLSKPAFLHLLTVICGHLILVFCIHAALMVYAALRMTTVKWLIMRTAIYPMMIAMMILDLFLYPLK